MNNIEALKRFENSEDEFKLTKIGSKRSSLVGVGHSEAGSFILIKIPEDAHGPEAFVAYIQNYGRYLRTSPIVKIVDQDDTSTTFETNGGIYKLEKL